MNNFLRLSHPSKDFALGITVGAVSAIATITLVVVSGRIFQEKQEKIIRSPRSTLLPGLTESEKTSLPYPIDILPGGRDVDSPYGTIRVYEWGPEEGRKVLFIHGISTPCISLGAVAEGLAAKGSRVMLFDLWGRGYSDSCADLDYDDRLYATQILIAVTSSPLSWTGGTDGGFSIIGYSLGGGISASFTSYFPAMVKSLVLLAPSGLIRAEHMTFRSKFLYSIGIVPEGVLKWLVKQRMKARPKSKAKSQVDTQGLLAAESKDTTSNPLYSNSLSKLYRNVKLEDAVAWQIDAHNGYVHSFMSSIRFSPITGQQSTWRRLALREDKTLIMAGSTDPIIVPTELKIDAEDCLGKDRVEWRLIDGAHDFPVAKADDVVSIICDYWKL